MSTDESSNRRCTWLLNQRDFRYWREADIGQVLPLQGTNPDFLVETPVPVRFFLELKSFEQDTLLDRIDPSVRTFSVGIRETGPFAFHDVRRRSRVARGNPKAPGRLTPSFALQASHVKKPAARRRREGFRRWGGFGSQRQRD